MRTLFGVIPLPKIKNKLKQKNYWKVSPCLDFLWKTNDRRYLFVTHSTLVRDIKVLVKTSSFIASWSLIKKMFASGNSTLDKQFSQSNITWNLWAPLPLCTDKVMVGQKRYWTFDMTHQGDSQSGFLTRVMVSHVHRC